MKNKNILIVIIVVGTFITTALLFWQKEKPVQKPNEATSEQNISIPEESETVKPVSSEIDLSAEAIEDWATCRNEEYGYEFKYPSGWYIYKTIISTEESYPVKTDSCQAQFITLSPNLPVRNGFYTPTIQNYVLNSAWTSSLEEYLQTLNTELYPVTVIRSDTVDGVKIIQYVRQDFPQAILLHEGNIFNLSTQTKNKGGQTNLLNAVISTLKFID